MGHKNREQERLDGIRFQAEAILLKYNAIELTDTGSDEYSIMNNDEAEKLAFKKGEKMCRAGEVDGTGQEMAKAIQSVLDNAVFDYDDSDLSS